MFIYVHICISIYLSIIYHVSIICLLSLYLWIIYPFLLSRHAHREKKRKLLSELAHVISLGSQEFTLSVTCDTQGASVGKGYSDCLQRTWFLLLDDGNYRHFSLAILSSKPFHVSFTPLFQIHAHCFYQLLHRIWKLSLKIILLDLRYLVAYTHSHLKKTWRSKKKHWESTTTQITEAIMNLIIFAKG